MANERCRYEGFPEAGFPYTGNWRIHSLVYAYDLDLFSINALTGMYNIESIIFVVT